VEMTGSEKNCSYYGTELFTTVKSFTVQAQSFKISSEMKSSSYSSSPF
jgi:hypothetical protein